MGFRRIPAFLLLLVWSVAAAVVDRDGGFHEARLLNPAPVEPIQIEDAWSDWLSANNLPLGESAVTEGAPHASRRTVPLVFIASSGGASRSAYWTSLVLDCLFSVAPTSCPEPVFVEPLRTNSVFVASGISGGSVGLAAWFAATFPPVGSPDVAVGADLPISAGDDGPRAWYDLIYERDLLAPALARLLYVDVPNAWIHSNAPSDRAAVLEQELEAAVAQASGWSNAFSRGIFETAREPRETSGSTNDSETGIRFPLLLLNGASVEDGCRLNGSALVLADPDTTMQADQERAMDVGDECKTVADVIAGPVSALAGSRDLFHFACDKDGRQADLRLSTAALLSARFPYVTPSGALRRCADPDDRTFVVDGGNIDSSGASTIIELLARLQPTIDRYNATHPDVCVTPVMIQIDNSYLNLEVPVAASRPLESLAPLQGIFAAMGARADTARQAAAINFRAPPAAYCRGGATLSRYVQLVPRSHPGVESPMGWALSNESRQDLLNEFRTAPNQGCMRVIESWFRGAFEIDDVVACSSG
jgi:hypothetical protein